MPSRKKHGGGHDEEHENHERWLITYADMLTLLMVLFIVMYAMSQVDKKKFAELASGLANGFGAKTVAFQGQTQIMDGKGNDTSITPLWRLCLARRQRSFLTLCVRDATAMGV